MTRHVTGEIASQPETWQRAIALLPDVAPWLPSSGERIAVIGCGTSWFMAMSYASLREQGGHGESDAFSGSEVPFGRSYDRAVLISRSGTTTEIIRALEEYAGRGIPTVVITAVADSPVVSIADHAIVLDFADEQSVVQTRFATTVLALLRAHLGEDLAPAIADARRALDLPLEERLALTQVTFIGLGWTIGLAQEAALKTREAAQFWAEAYPAMDYRHGPFAIAEAGRGVWSLGAPPAGLAGEVEGTGALMIDDQLDPLAELIIAQRFAVAMAEGRGLNPDTPRNLTRAVHLADETAR
jgi:fructoselysine-6-P-deglycase FrlB-like protein